MERLPRKEIVEIRRIGLDEYVDRIPLENEEVIGTIDDGQKKIEIVKGLSYSDHPLLTGALFKLQDIKILSAGRTFKEVSGVHGASRVFCLKKLLMND